jgi:HD-like signal output (HDOD) protein
MARSLERLVDGAAWMPSLPRIYTQLTQVLDNPRASTAQIADIIGGDPSLTARLLRLVNSAFYCFPSKVENIADAVWLVGTEQIRDLALATSVLRVFGGISSNLVDMESFWVHSIATGVTARLLATHRRETNGERFFVAGVLHDIGRLLMYRTLPFDARKALLRARRTAEPLLDAERETFGFDHAAAGGALLRAWDLPPSLTEIVQCHHAPGEARQYPVEVAVVHLSDVIVTAMGMGHSGDEAVPRLAPEAWQRIGVPPGVLGAVVEQAAGQIQDVRRSVLDGA